MEIGQSNDAGNKLLRDRRKLGEQSVKPLARSPRLSTAVLIAVFVAMLGLVVVIVFGLYAH